VPDAELVVDDDGCLAAPEGLTTGEWCVRREGEIERERQRERQRER
jgi:hypothetical protein